MRPPDYLMVLPPDVSRVGLLGAAILALVRYVTGLPGEANGRRLVDGAMWWRASHDDIAQALGGGVGVSCRTVSRTVRELLNKGELLAIPADDFFGDRAQAYRPSGVPLARSDIGPDVPSVNMADRSAKMADLVGQNRHTRSANMANLPIPLKNSEDHYVGGEGAGARGNEPPDPVVDPERRNDHPTAIADPMGDADDYGHEDRPASNDDDRPETVGACVPAVIAPRRSDGRGTRLPNDWTPDRPVIDAMRAKHPRVDLGAEHAKFVDYWAAKPGAGGRKVDWNATWRNWIRRADEYATAPARRSGSSVTDNVNGWLSQVPDDGDESEPWM